MNKKDLSQQELEILALHDLDEQDFQDRQDLQDFLDSLNWDEEELAELKAKWEDQLS